MHDLVFATFEDEADDRELIRDLDADFGDHAFWESGNAHRGLAHGEIVRTTGHLQLFDPQFFRARLNQLIAIVDALVELQVTSEAAESLNISRQKNSQSKSKLEKDRLARKDELKRDFWGADTTDEQIRAMGDLMAAYQGDSIALRCYPCGPEYSQFTFSGSLLNRREYIQEEREQLFSRFGLNLKDWTVVFQVASIPDPTATRADLPEMTPPADSNGLNRAVLEAAAAELMSFMDGLGIAEGPRWPMVSVTPLAIYRTVPVRRAT